MGLRGTLIGGTPIVVGLFIAMLAASSNWRLYQAQSWVAVPGEVLTSSLTVSSGRGGVPTYWPQVMYRYSASGAVHIGNAVQLGPATAGRAEAEEVLRAYPVGARPAVYVDPQNSENSVLDRRSVSGAVYWQLGIAAALVIIGGTLAVALWRIEL